MNKIPLCIVGILILFPILSTTPTALGYSASAPPEAADKSTTSADTATPTEEREPGFLETLWELNGRSHPILVHFPIALLFVAAGIIVLRKPFPKLSLDVALYCVVIAAAGAIAACIAGWEFASISGYTKGIFDQSNETIFYHRWGGVFVAVCATLFAFFALKSAKSGYKSFNKTWQLGTLLTAASVGLVGHWGGNLTYGDDLERAIFRLLGMEYTYHDEHDQPKKPTKVTPPPSKDEKVDFVKHIQPILEARCVECHGPSKKKGDIRLHTKANAFTLSETLDETFKIITPGNPEKSTLYLGLIVDPDDEDSDLELMPPKKKKGPLPKNQIDLIKRWITEGANWPDGITLKEPSK